MFNRRLRVLQIHRDVNHTRQAIKGPQHVPFARATRHAANRQRRSSDGRLVGFQVGHTHLTQRASEHYTCNLPEVAA
jgi:hypothetical protein